MDTVLIIQLIEFIFAFSGVILSVIWFFREKRRTRYAPVVFALWCLLVVVFRIIRWCYPTQITDSELEVFRSVGDTILLLGSTIVNFLSIVAIKGMVKYGHR
jgi:prolipoprotein diacylglyceryltransferase